MDHQYEQSRKQVEEGMWAVLRRHLLARRAANVAAAGSCGLWKAPHVSQYCHWDCGVACAQMVLRGLGRESERSSLLASLGTRSVWTIDLAMLLHRQGVRFTYCTRTAGVTETYSTIDFYRANFDRDAPRVQSLFKEAEEAKVGAVQKAFSWQELAVLVSSYDYAAIVLVDSRHLYPASCRAATPALAPPSPAAAVATLPSPSPSPTTAHRGVSPAWSTPKRHREDDVGMGAFGRGEGVGEASEEEAGAPSRRRRRRRPRAALVGGGGDDGRGEELCNGPVEMAPVFAHGRQLPPVRVAPPASPAAPEDGSGEGGERGPGARALLRDLRVSPAPHAVEREVVIPSFTSPAPPQSGGKTLGGDPDGAVRVGGASEGREIDSSSLGRAEVPLIFSPAANSLLSPVSLPGAPSPVKSGASCSSPLLASPPPLTNAACCAPASATSRSSGSGGLCPTRGATAPPDSSYCGHYILLVGWSEADGVFIARDPALPSPSDPAGAAGGGGRGDPASHVCIALTPEALDKARLSYGTDEDVLVVDLARSRKGGVSTAPLAAAAAATALAASAASSAAAASAMVGLLAMAAAAAAAGADASGFKEWVWPDPAAWFGGYAGGSGDGGGGAAGSIRGGGDGRSGTAEAGTAVAGMGGSLPQGGAESAAKRLASLLSLAASGWRFPTVPHAYRGPRVSWGGAGAVGGGGGGASDSEAEEEGERWAARMASAVEGLLQGGRRAAYTMEGFLQGGAHTMEGLLQGGRRAAYTMEGLLEGGRRAAYSLRDSLADVAEAPGGAGAECCTVAWSSPGSPVPPTMGAVMSPA